ncbi:hypothetical protein [Pseudomonas sp. AM8]|uniref:hypothetical protein n=1 Tax=Pseudomonas sp. AM8 TaxID=2983368 RepID=UPI002E81D645|nr:hypothetical protein [Pseudomonas sp. AM8]
MPTVQVARASEQVDIKVMISQPNPRELCVARRQISSERNQRYYPERLIGGI